MSPPASDSSADDGRLHEIIAAFLEAVEAGREPAAESEGTGQLDRSCRGMYITIGLYNR
jgi:hypothetical protein